MKVRSIMKKQQTDLESKNNKVSDVRKAVRTRESIARQIIGIARCGGMRNFKEPMKNTSRNTEKEEMLELLFTNDAYSCKAIVVMH